MKYPIADPHTFSVEEILYEFQVDATTGISKTEAEKRTIEFGSNVYEAQKQKSILLMMLLQFKSPIVYLLLFAMVVTFYFQNFIDTIAILIVILINALIGFFNGVTGAKFNECAEGNGCNTFKSYP